MIKGLTPEETAALRTVFSLALGRDRVARRCRRYLDGDTAALDGAPTIKAALDNAAKVINESTRKESNENT